MLRVGSVVIVLALMACGGVEGENLCVDEDGETICTMASSAVYSPNCMQDKYGNPIADGVVCGASFPGGGPGTEIGICSVHYTIGAGGTRYLNKICCQYSTYYVCVPFPYGPSGDGQKTPGTAGTSPGSAL